METQKPHPSVCVSLCHLRRSYIPPLHTRKKKESPPGIILFFLHVVPANFPNFQGSNSFQLLFHLVLAVRPCSTQLEGAVFAIVIVTRYQLVDN